MMGILSDMAYSGSGKQKECFSAGLIWKERAIEFHSLSKTSA